MKKVYRAVSLLLCLMLAVGCSTATPPTTTSTVPLSSVVTAELTPQVTLDPQQHLNFLLGCGALGKAWASVNELDPDAILGYYMALSQAEERLPMPDLTYPKNPKYDDYSLMYAAPVEQMAMLYFGMTAEQLHKSQYYFPEQDCYELPGLGSVASCTVRDTYDNDKHTVIQFEIFWDGAPYADCKLTIDKSPDGSWCYKSFELEKPDVTAEQQEEWLPVLSLLQNGCILSYSWESGNEIPADFFTTFYTFTLLASPDSSLIDSKELLIPTKEFEDYMQSRFEVTSDHLRKAGDYNAARGSYRLYGGVGGSGPLRLNSVTEQDGNILLGYRVYSMADDPAWEGILTVKRDGDHLRYLSNQVKPCPLPISVGGVDRGKPLEQFDALTAEQKALYEKGLEGLYSWFRGDIGAFATGDNQGDERKHIELNGKTYDEYTGNVFASWDDFYKTATKVFTPAQFERLITIRDPNGENPYPFYINHEGKIYYLPLSYGGNPTLCDEPYQFSANLVQDDYISFRVYSFYLDRDDVRSAGAKPVSVLTNEVIMRKNADGWRIDKLDLPWL